MQDLVSAQLPSPTFSGCVLPSISTACSRHPFCTGGEVGVCNSSTSRSSRSSLLCRRLKTRRWSWEKGAEIRWGPYFFIPNFMVTCFLPPGHLHSILSDISSSSLHTCSNLSLLKPLNPFSISRVYPSKPSPFALTFSPTLLQLQIQSFHGLSRYWYFPFGYQSYSIF